MFKGMSNKKSKKNKNIEQILKPEDDLLVFEDQMTYSFNFDYQSHIKQDRKDKQYDDTKYLVHKLSQTGHTTS